MCNLGSLAFVYMVLELPVIPTMETWVLRETLFKQHIVYIIATAFPRITK